MTEPKYAQSTCACSAGKTCNRRKASWGCGRTRDHAPQLFDTAGVATIPNHLLDAHGTQPWILLQHLAHKRQIRIDNGGPQRLWRGLKAMGVKTEMVVYPNEGHAFHSPAHQEDVLLRMIRWFNENLAVTPG